MKYKIEKGTETFQKLQEFLKTGEEYNKQAFKLVAELGFEEWVLPHHTIAGGIGGVSAKAQPEGYKKLSQHGIFFPKQNKTNKPIIERICALPRLANKDLNDILNFKWQFVGLRCYSRPAIVASDDFYLIDVNDVCEYEPLPDMQEILGSEYKSLSEIALSKNRQAEETV